MRGINIHILSVCSQMEIFFKHVVTFPYIPYRYIYKLPFATENFRQYWVNRLTITSIYAEPVDCFTNEKSAPRIKISVVLASYSFLVISHRHCHVLSDLQGALLTHSMDVPTCTCPWEFFQNSSCPGLLWQIHACWENLEDRL